MTTPTLAVPELVAPATAGSPVAPGDPVRLRACRCPACGRADVPARDRCPACDVDAEPLLLPTHGTLRLASSVLHPPPDALVPTPYHVGVVSFDGGRDVMGLLTEDGTDLLGSTVETVAVEFAPGRLTYAFRPANPTDGRPGEAGGRC